MKTDVDDPGLRVQMRIRGKDRVIVVPQARLDQWRTVRNRVLREPFTARPWLELAFYLVGGAAGFVAIVFLGATMAAGTFLLVTFLGLVIIAGSLRGIRGIGQWHRNLARLLLHEEIEDPQPFIAKPGFFGWLQSALRDRVAWRGVVYTLAKVPVVLFGLWFGLGTWISAFRYLASPFVGQGFHQPQGFGVIVQLLPAQNTGIGIGNSIAYFILGLILLFIAPWPMRLVVFVDRWLMRSLLGPDPVAARMRTLEAARTQTVDTSAATLRRIERDLHDGTQAQLVALAMRLGQAKEKLATGSDADLEQVRRLIDEAHGGAKEAIVELRDLARGIHPPVLDTGLEGALSTLAARSALQTDLTVTLTDRPTPAIEAIAYFCVAELLANVAQHAQASRASISCAQMGDWIRLVVRDDGRGGAQPALTGSASSGLAGLIERVHTVDGRMYITSPVGGPTVVTVDLPLHA